MQEEVVVEAGHHEHRDNADEGEEPLPDDRILEACGGAIVGAKAAAVDEHQPVSDQRQRSQSQDRIEAVPGAEGTLNAKAAHGSTFSRK